MHWSAFGYQLKVPEAQLVHPRSFVAEPGVETYVPALQVDQLAHVSALSVVLKVPLEHGAHTRFRLVFGVCVTL